MRNERELGLDLSQDRKRWYVDVDGDIRGPFQGIEIVRKLVEAEFSIKHRVSIDRQSWRAICNEEFFEQIVQEMITELATTATGANTNSSVSLPALTPDLTESSRLFNTDELKKSIQSQLEQANLMAEINVGMNTLRRLHSDILANKKIVVTVSTKPKIEFHPDDQNVVIHKKVKEPRRPLNQNLFFRAMGLFAILLAIGNIGHQYFEAKQEREHLEAVSSAKAQAIEAKVAGDYEKALGIFQKIKDEKSIDATTLLAMSEAALASKKPNDARAFLLRALKLSPEAAVQARARSLLGLVAFRENNLAQAEIEFGAATKAGGDVYSSLHNLGIVYLMQDQPEKAEAVLLKAVELGIKGSEPSLIALFEAAWLLEKSSRGVVGAKFERLTQVEKSLYQLAQVSVEYRERALLAQAMVAFAKGESEKMAQLMSQFLAQSPVGEASESPRLEIDYTRSNWAHLYRWCAELFTALQTSTYANAVFAKCQLRTENPEIIKRATPYAQYAYATTPANREFKAVYGLSLIQNGAYDDAKALYANVAPEQMSKAGFFVMMKVCEFQADKTCQDRYRDLFHQASAVDPRVPAGK